MICPHCGVSSFEDWTQTASLFDKQGSVDIESFDCPACKMISIAIITDEAVFQNTGRFKRRHRNVVRPVVTADRIVHESVPARFAKDYKEAAAVLGISSAASATLGRRCIQDVIRHELKNRMGDEFKPSRDLYGEIEKFRSLPGVPKFLADSLHDVREIGGFAAHPTEDADGILVNADSDDAIDVLDTIDLFFGFVFVDPNKREKMKIRVAEKKKATRPDRKPD